MGEAYTVYRTPVGVDVDIWSVLPSGGVEVVAVEVPIQVQLPSVPVLSPYVPAGDSEAVEAYLDGTRRARLKKKYGWGKGLPKLLRESCPPEQLERADALRVAGLEERADRAEICNLVGELFHCPECWSGFKHPWGCGLRSCPSCAKRIFNRAFAELVPLDKEIPGALRSLSGWGWKILDLTFRHDGDYPSREEMREMRRVVNRVADRAVREKCREMYLAGKRCRIRFDENGSPMWCEGWPYVSAPDGSARVLRGWVLVRPGRVAKRSTCLRCGSRVKKIRGMAIGPHLPSSVRLCSKCGLVGWPDWENQKVDTRRWKLRFGIVHIPVSEFGYSKETGGPNYNYHFHGCYFGPFLPFERVVEIFREESRKAFCDGTCDSDGACEHESRGVLIEKAQRGYRSALAHSLKYAGLKMPASTPEGLALYEKILIGVRRYAVRGFFQGVQIEREKRGAPKCPVCRKELKRVPGLGVVPLSEIEDIPFLPDDEPDYADEFKGDEFCFREPEEMAAYAPRAPC